jgi:hypothetical protein
MKSGFEGTAHRTLATSPSIAKRELLVSVELALEVPATIGDPIRGLARPSPPGGEGERWRLARSLDHQRLAVRDQSR